MPEAYLPAELIEQFLDLAGGLSPENLSCDGEISAYLAGQRRKQLLREWRQLEIQAGRAVTID